MPDPKLLTLGEWGGTPNGWPAMTLPAVALWAHHSVTNEDVGVNATDDAVADFLELDAIGLSRGHGGISYSYAIHPEGVIGEGQGRRRGAHTAGNGCNGSPWGWNPCSFGVVFVGNYDDDVLTDAAVQSFRWLRDVLIYTGALVPGVYPTGGHQDAPGNATGCPGHNIENNLDLLRQPYNASPAPALPKEPAMDYILARTDDGLRTLCTALGETEGIDEGYAEALIAGGMTQVKIDGVGYTNMLVIRRAQRSAFLASIPAGDGGGPLSVTLTGTATPPPRS
jgi:hypothetical protein